MVSDSPITDAIAAGTWIEEPDSEEALIALAESSLRLPASEEVLKPTALLHDSASLMIRDKV